MTVRDFVSHQLNAVSRKRCLMSFSQAPVLPCSRVLLFVLLLCTFALLLLCSPSAVHAGWVWQNPKPQGHYLNAVCFIDDQTGYVAGNAGTIMKTTDGGNTWSIQMAGLGVRLKSLSFPLVAQPGYAFGGGGIFKTTNGGTTWRKQLSLWDLWLESVDFPKDAQTGYAVGKGGIIIKTNNGGTTWASQTSGTGGDLFSVHFPKDVLTGYTAGYHWEEKRSIILKTTDGGGHWVDQQTGATKNLHSIHFASDAQTGYTVGLELILKTTNGGNDWGFPTLGSRAGP